MCNMFLVTYQVDGDVPLRHEVLPAGQQLVELHQLHDVHQQLDEVADGEDRDDAEEGDPGGLGRLVVDHVEDLGVVTPDDEDGK